MYEHATFDGSCSTFDSYNNEKFLTFDYTIIIVPSSSLVSIPVVYAYVSSGEVELVGSSQSIVVHFVVVKNNFEFKSKIVPFWIGSGTVFEMKPKNKLMIAPWLVGDPLMDRRTLK
jgi:hypothetical protein